MSSQHSQTPPRGQLAAVILRANQRVLEGRQPKPVGEITSVVLRG